MLKLLVPTGYMIGNDHGVPAIVICPGTGPTAAAAPMSGMAGGMSMHGVSGQLHEAMPDHGQPRDHGKTEMPCAYAGLSAQLLGAVDPVMLAIALAIVAALARTAVPLSAPKPAPHLRPPLRGPPVPLT